MRDSRENLTLKGLIAFSIPSIFSSVLEPLSGIVDSALVGRIDTRWLASIAICSVILSSFTWMFNFLIHASTQTISESASSNNQQELLGRIKQSLSLATGIGVIVGLGLFVFKDLLFNIAGTPVSLKELVNEYFCIRALCHILVIIYITLISILRGLSLVKLSFYIVFTSTFLNIILTWLFLYHFNFGITGAAWGTALSNFLGCLLSFIFLVKEKRVGVKFLKAKTIRKDALSFKKNSLDIFGRSLALTSCFFIATRIAAQIGVESLAAHQILLQVWLFSSFFIDGVAVTGNIYGASLISAKKKLGLKDLERKLNLISGVLGLLFMLIFFLFKDLIISNFTQDAEVLAVINTIWPYLAISQIFMALSYNYDGLLFGVSYFKYLRKMMALGVLLIFLPIGLMSLLKQDLIFVWYGLIVLGVFRLVSGAYGMKLAIKGISNE